MYWFQLQLARIRQVQQSLKARQYNIVPNSPRFTVTVLACAAADHEWHVVARCVGALSPQQHIFSGDDGSSLTGIYQLVD